MFGEGPEDLKEVIECCSQTIDWFIQRSKYTKMIKMRDSDRYMSAKWLPASCELPMDINVELPSASDAETVPQESQPGQMNCSTFDLEMFMVSYE